MKLSIEISMYPFHEDYIPPIKGFIDWLNRHNDVLIETFPTCTIVTGDYNRVMDLLRDGIKYSYENYGKAVFVTKFLPDFEALS